MKRTPPVKRSKEEGGDEAYLEFIRSLPCCMCDRRGPSHPHHSTGAGMGLKAPDREAMPLCAPHYSSRGSPVAGCHRDFHDGNGAFDGWTRADKNLWQGLQVARCQELYAIRSLTQDPQA